MKKHQLPLEEGRFYHVYNRGNNGDNLYYNNENYKFFLRRYNEYLSPFVETYAFCLLPNHFHLLIRVKEKEAHEGEKALLLAEAKLLKDATSQAFHRFFTSYSKAINKQEGRHGSLFENPFKRKEITSTEYLTHLVFYIHANPQLHGIANNFEDYPWSSYNRILNQKPTSLQKSTVIDWFSDSDNYIAFHAQKIDIAEIKNLIIEE